MLILIIHDHVPPFANVVLYYQIVYLNLIFLIDDFLLIVVIVLKIVVAFVGFVFPFAFAVVGVAVFADHPAPRHHQHPSL